MFFDFLLDLRIREIPVYVTDFYRIRLVLSIGGEWSYERFMETLRSLLVRDVEQDCKFEDSFSKFFGNSPFFPDSSIDVDTVLDELRSVDSILLTDIAQKDILTDDVLELYIKEEKRQKGKKYKLQDSEESLDFHKERLLDDDSLERDTEISHKPLEGRREYSLRLPLPPLLQPDFFDGFSDDVGYFITEQSDDQIDIKQSLEKTCRKGYPEIVPKSRLEQRQVIILKDQFIRKRMIYDLAKELAEGLSNRGLSVKQGIFYGSPEFFTHEDGGEYRLDDFDDNRNGFLVLIFSDSQGIDPYMHRMLLEDMGHWPFLFWLETRPESQWDDITRFIGEYVPVYPSTKDSLHRISQQLRSETFSSESLPVTYYSESIEEILRDTLPWACACALLQPIDFGIAEHFRKKYFESIPKENIQLLSSLPGAIRTNTGLIFSIRTRNRLLEILRSRWPVKETNLRRELDTLFESDPDKPSENTAAYLIWRMHLALNKLQIDEDTAYSGARMLLDLLSSQIGYVIEESFQKLVEKDTDYSVFIPMRPLEWDYRTKEVLKELNAKRHMLFSFKTSSDAEPEINIEGLKIQKGMIGFVSPEVIVESPELLIKIFEEGARLNIPLSHEARRLVKHYKKLVDDDFRSSPSAARSFERILAESIRPLNMLQEMMNISLLSSYLPEFKGITDQIEYDEYQNYPVDKHSLDTVRRLGGFGVKDDQIDSILHDIYHEISNPMPLLWAGFFHDIGGKKPGGEHEQKGAEIVNNVLGRMGYDNNTIDTVSFLVREHLFLIKVATRRDINDEETAILVARRVGSVERLKKLYLLSVAHAMAMGPKAWNDWNASLLRFLFLKTLNVLEKGELVSRKAIRTIEQKKERILTMAGDKIERLAIDQLLPYMSPRYLLYTPSREIPEHIQLYHQLQGKDFVWHIAKSSAADTRTVTICAQDRPGLLSKIVGTFTLNGINILDMRIFTWRNNIALDIFEVEPPPDRLFEQERWNKAAGQLQAALDDELDLNKELTRKRNRFQSIQPLTKSRPQKVVVDNESSSFFTLIEVTAWDYPGLLFQITNALFHCRLDIWVAIVSTWMDQVVHVFYVRSYDGEKVDLPEQITSIKNVVGQVLTDF